MENKINKLEKICVWRKILKDNLNGIGTTFNTNKKNKGLERLGCYECKGYNPKCRYYTK